MNGVSRDTRLFTSLQKFIDMKRSLLLPYSFRKIGWIIMIPSIILGAYMLIDGSLNGWLKLDESESWETVVRILNNIAIIGTIVGSVFISCSKEKVEDEMISAMRTNSLLLSLYIDFGLLIVASLLFYEFDFLSIMFLQLCALPVLFVIIWEVSKARMKRRFDNEK